MSARRRVLVLLAAITAAVVLGAGPAHAAVTDSVAPRPAAARVVLAPHESPGCGGIFIVSQVCRMTVGSANDVIHGKFVKAAGDLLGGNGATAERLYHSASCATSPLDCVAAATADAAGAAFRWLWRTIDTATSINLIPLFHPFTGSGQSLMDVTIEIAALIGLALFFVQIVVSALRAEPGGVGRALRGLVSAYLGSIIAILSIPLLDAAITQVCNGIVKTVTGNDLSGFGKTLAVAMGLSGLTGAGLPIVLILVGFAIIASAVIVWGAMMIRKMLVVVAAVFAPLAFSGATSDMTKNWMRRWIEVTLALLFSKLLLVIILTVGFMMMNGYGSPGGITNTLTNVCIGVLLLALGGFAPLMALKMVHFAGDGFAHLHAQAAATRAHTQSLAAAPQKIHATATRMGGARSNGSAPRNGASSGMPQQRGALSATARGVGGKATANGAPAGAALGAATAARHVATAPSTAAARVGAAATSATPPADDHRPPKVG